MEVWTNESTYVPIFEYTEIEHIVYHRKFIERMKHMLSYDSFDTVSIDCNVPDQSK